MLARLAVPTGRWPVPGRSSAKMRFSRVTLFAAILARLSSKWLSHHQNIRSWHTRANVVNPLAVRIRCEERFSHTPDPPWPVPLAGAHFPRVECRCRCLAVLGGVRQILTTNTVLLRNRCLRPRVIRLHIATNHSLAQAQPHERPSLTRQRFPRATNYCSSPHRR